MVAEHQHEQLERRETLDNDRRLREQQGTTLHAFAQEETLDRGRFGAIGKPTVIGSTPARNIRSYPRRVRGTPTLCPTNRLSATRLMKCRRAFDNCLFSLRRSSGCPGARGSVVRMHLTG